MDLTIGNRKAMPPDPDGLHRYVNKYDPGHQSSIAYEVGFRGYCSEVLRGIQLEQLCGQSR